MPLTITEPAKYTNINPIDFRMKAARTKGLEAQADNYRLDTMAKKKAMESQARRAEVLKQVMTNPELKDDESKLQAAGHAFMGGGDYEGWNAVQKSLQDLKKSKIEQQKLQAEAQEKKSKVIAPIAFDLEQNPSDENIVNAIKRMGYMGLEQEASMLKEMWEQNPKATPEQRSQWFGQFVPKEYRTLVQVDTGTEKKMVPNVGKGVTSFGVDVSPNTRESIASRESIATARLNQRERHHRENLSSAKTEAIGKIPAGFQMKNGRLERIPGHPDELKTEDQMKRDIQHANARVKDIDMVLGHINEAEKGTGFMTTGMTGWLASLWKGSDAYDQQQTIDSIKANIGFTRLEQMRKESKTGGALGQIAVRELDFLQSVLGSLDIGQGETKFKSNLAKIKTHYNNAKKAYQDMVRKQGRKGVFDQPEASEEVIEVDW